MLAAVTGLVYTVGNLLRLEGYLAYGLPLPIVLAALRSGPLPALKTLTVAVLLLLSERRERAGGEGASAAGNVAALWQRLCRWMFAGCQAAPRVHCLGGPSS